MKRILALAVLTALLFTGCAGKTSEKKTVTVGLVETEGCQIEENARQVAPGANVSFTVTVEQGFALVGVDYDGEYAIWNSDGKLRLELKNVRYPGRYHLRLSKTDSTILFEPNGGQGEALTVTRDLSYHVRPNTAPVAFDRPGYSLVAWNTEPDGSGEQIGLGSRIANPDSGKLTLYAQWAAWSSESDFQAENGKILAYTGSEESIVIPESIGGETVTAIAEGAFTDCTAQEIIFPKTLETVEAGAFRNCALRELTFYDSIRFLPSDAFRDCENFSTLHINAQRPPYGSHYRRESLLADKLDLLILNQGKQKIVFYGGCSMWYNLDGPVMRDAVSPDYQVVNVAVNGLINSAVQMQIITALLEEGDIFFHTPELSSEQQMLCQMGFTADDSKLWCGLEYNYDLVSYVDIRETPGLLDSYQVWRDRKQETGNYDEHYEDAAGNIYFDPETGSIPFDRYKQEDELVDKVNITMERVRPENLARLEAYYRAITAKGVRVYVSCACINVDVIPEGQRGTVRQVSNAFSQAVNAMDGVTMISDQMDYLYRNEDFYDTNYHLLSQAARRNTENWLQDLKTRMVADGLWKEAGQ